jgi:hypothetical protein
MGTPASRLHHDLYKGPKLHTDPGNGKAIIVNEDLQICEMVSGASGETRTLPRPSKSGIRLVLRMKTDGGGDIVITATGGFNVAGETQATFADASDFLSLISVTVSGDGPSAVRRWEALEGNLGTVISSASASSSPSSTPSASASTSPSASPSPSASTSSSPSATASPSASASGSPSSSPSAT